MMLNSIDREDTLNQSTQDQSAKYLQVTCKYVCIFWNISEGKVCENKSKKVTDVHTSM